MSVEGRSHHDVNVTLLLTVGGIGTLLLVVLVLGTQAWFRYETLGEAQTKIIAPVSGELQQLQQQQMARLQGGRWVDAQQQTATIPIERAMQLTIARYQQGWFKNLPQPEVQSPAQAAPAAQPEAGATEGQNTQPQPAH